MRGLAIRLGVIAVIVGGGFVLRDRFSGSASDLRVGDCFDQPSAQQDIKDVQHHPCTESHTAEIVFVGDHPEASAYPGVDAFDSYVVDHCVAAFESYTGRDYETDTELDLGYFFPTTEGWPKGDHEIACWVYRLDDTAMKTSVKVAN